jgi:hypothetical protein
MYYIIVIATTLALPIGAALIESFALNSATGLILLLGKWYAFFAVGVRLFLAGLRQTFTPGFTLKEIFEIDAPEANHIVQELGFANLSMGALGLLALLDPMLTLAGAVTGGLYYGFAGLKHIATGKRNAMRTTAMVTDILVFAVLALYVATAAGMLIG